MTLGFLHAICWDMSTMGCSRLLCICAGVMTLLQVAGASGSFELVIEDLQVLQPELASGSCCQGARAVSGCPGSCRPSVWLCLKAHARQVDTCMFGNSSTPVLTPEGSVPSQAQDLTTAAPEQRTILLPFDFAWTRAYTLVLEVRHINDSGDGHLMSRSTHTGVALPEGPWQTLKTSGPLVALTYRLRVVCDHYYYGPTCTKLCRPRHDTFGHYTCSGTGEKVCLEGWMGPNCDTAICKPGCDSVHGSCTRPGTCRCAYGWQGEYCDLCVPHPGCKHGSCNGSPWACVCDLNWGGLFCDKDLNYCGRHRPCVNGGLCSHDGPEDYQCHCPPGFTGVNCERAESICASFPCQHQGTCTEMMEGYTCYCPPGWSGDHCQIDIDECTSSPCLHGGTCHDVIAGFFCACATGWLGPVCQLDANECGGQPCVHASGCSNLLGSYRCLCEEGWTGQDCDVNLDDCAAATCLHGGSCVVSEAGCDQGVTSLGGYGGWRDRVAGYSCACAQGFSGPTCELDENECMSAPCDSSAICEDLPGGFRCICAPGTSGDRCQHHSDPCASVPCHQGSTCYHVGTDFYCRCPQHYTGKTCETQKPNCTGVACQVVDGCSTVASGDPAVGHHPGSCGFHGDCVNLHQGKVSCVCHPGYTGVYCHQNINDCAGTPCEQGGTCIDEVGSFSCVCPEGWEGVTCQTNTNDCASAPCRNGGSCHDLEADFRCDCVDGWKGHACNLRQSHCDPVTCAHGGTCVDLGTTFSCRCPAGWQGPRCTQATSSLCDDSACLHGGTCVSSGHVVTCLCGDGFEGPGCETNIDDCNPYPCYNQGVCIDGDNWYLCECAAGFTGHECRTNIDECSSSPCAFGSTCEDLINHFRCYCPPGRTGTYCEDVVGPTDEPSSCVHERREYASGDTWFHDCHTCRCQGGHVTCHEVPCGPVSCGPVSDDAASDVVPCPSGTVCVQRHQGMCFTPPCVSQAHCVPAPATRQPNGTAPGPETKAGTMWNPHMTYWSEPCSVRDPSRGHACCKITIIFNMEFLPLGVYVDDICDEVVSLATQSVEAANSRYSCAQDTAAQDSIVFSVAVEESEIDDDNGSPETDAISGTLQHTWDALTWSLSNVGLGNRTLLGPMVEIRMETATKNEDYQNGTVPSYLVWAACAAMALTGVLAIVLLAVYHYTQLKRRKARHDEYLRSRPPEEKPLKDDAVWQYRDEESKPSSRDTHKSACTELLQLDIEKYEKTATDETTRKSNDSRNNRPTVKTPKEKNINIELSRHKQNVKRKSML